MFLFEIFVCAISPISRGVNAQDSMGVTRLYACAEMHAVHKRIYYKQELRAGKELSTQPLQD